MRVPAPRGTVRPVLLLMLMGPALMASGCSNQGAGAGKPPAATRQLKHIEELQNKAAPSGKAR